MNTFLLSWYPNGFTLPSTLPNLWLPDCDLTVAGGNGSTVQFVTHSWLPPDSQFTSPRRSDTFGPYCRFESHQATKLAWAKLQTAVPLLHQLISHMRLSQSEYDELLSSALDLNRVPNQELTSGYYDLACRWVRLHRSRWQEWATGWDEKQNLTVAGLFTFYGKWVIPNLDQIALEAIDFVNRDSAYFGNTEYSLTMIIRNLTCVQDIVLNDYFDLVMSSAGKRLIGVIVVSNPRIAPHTFAFSLSHIEDFTAPLCNGINQLIRCFLARLWLLFLLQAFSPNTGNPTCETTIEYFGFKSRQQPCLILIRFFRHWNWRRVALFRKDNHFFDPRVFQVNGVDVIADFEMIESQLNFGLVKQGLEKMSEHNSRIFIVEYFARGTALVLCAAFRLGFYFDAGYVWFLNPWLSKDWWKSPDILPTQCTLAEMANITSWTFTLEHQVMRTVVYPNVREPEPDSRTVNRVARHNIDDPAHVTEAPTEADNQIYQSMESVDILEDHNYAVYTWESVIVLAKALVHLLRENPSSMSVFETVQIAEAYQRIVASTDISYTSSPDTFLSSREKSGADVTPELSAALNGNDPPVQVSSRLRFNGQNERAADFWILKQHRGPVTASIIRWSVIPPSASFSSQSNGSMSPDFGSERDEVPALMGEVLLEPVNWGRNNGPPGDGSQTEEHCTFLFISQLFGVSCSTATTICAIGMVVLLALPLFTLFIIYYRRKLKEAERLIRKPYEDLCEELVDIDWQQRPESMERIVTMLRMNPECVRPFLTDEPPKLKITISELPFQPGAGACIMSEHALASDGPASNNPPSSMAVVENLSNNHVTNVRGFHSTTGSLAGLGRSSLAYCSTDSFSETTTAATRLMSSEGHQQPTGRRRHKTAEGSVGLVRSHFLRRGTTSSSSGGHTCQGSEASSDDRSHGDLNQTKSAAALFTLSPLLPHGWAGSQPSPTRPAESTGQGATRISGCVGGGARRGAMPIGSSIKHTHREPHPSPRHMLLRKPGSLDDDELMELTPKPPKETDINCAHDLPDLVKSPSSTLIRHQDAITAALTNGPMNDTAASLLSSSKELTKQPNGMVSSTLRSLSAEYLSSDPERKQASSECTKSAPEGRTSAYVRNVPMKAVAEVDQQRLTDHRPKIVSTKHSDLISGRGSDGHPWGTNPPIGSRSVVDNASHLLRSMIRAIWRNSNTNKSNQTRLQGTTLRTTKSSTSCRALGAQDLSCTSQSNPDVEASNVSTSCPPLLMPQFSFLNSHVTDRSDGTSYPRASAHMPPVSAPPVQRSFFIHNQPQPKNNSLGNFSLTDRYSTPPLHTGTRTSLNSLSQSTVVFSPNMQVSEPCPSPTVFTKHSDQTYPTLPPSSPPAPSLTNPPEPPRETSSKTASPDPFYLV
ncbi:unnamed protein product [Echinostoma caproni]|uniref:Receptor ligand binding region domain-containing protein n=1 Tax=Echinostoma caproni TaxID=27848 RepID=A0A3P8G997_9TREM|nr:unnamed protein product [Echinostoma caproni]